MHPLAEWWAWSAFGGIEHVDHETGGEGSIDRLI